MLHISTRLSISGLLAIAALTLGGCGSGGDDSGTSVATLEHATAVSATPVTSNATGVSKGVSKVDPVVRPGANAPRDSAPDPALKSSGPDTPATAPPAGTTPAVGTVKQPLFATGFEKGVALTDPEGSREGDRYLVGGDTDGYSFPAEFWSAPNSWRNWVLSTVGEVSSTPVTKFLTASIKTVVGRHGTPSDALSLHSRVRSGGGGSQAIYVQNVGMAVESVTYQRMWIKFDTAMLKRAQATGATQYQQTLWEATARPDYRIRVSVRFDAVTGLYWHAGADRFDGDIPAWESRRSNAPIVLAPADQAAGWHQVEIWLDRPGARFSVAIDGQPLVDQRGDLMGESGNRIDQLRMMMVHSASAPLAEVLFDDLELWDSPPADASIVR